MNYYLLYLAQSAERTAKAWGVDHPDQYLVCLSDRWFARNYKTGATRPLLPEEEAIGKQFDHLKEVFEEHNKQNRRFGLTMAAIMGSSSLIILGSLLYRIVN